MDEIHLAFRVVPAMSLGGVGPMHRLEAVPSFRASFMLNLVNAFFNKYTDQSLPLMHRLEAVPSFRASFMLNLVHAFFNKYNDQSLPLLFTT